MISIKSILNKPVISLLTGRDYGLACSAVIQNAKITGIIASKKSPKNSNEIADKSPPKISENSPENSTSFLVPTTNILSIGADAIMLKSNENICPKKGACKIIDLKVFSQNGELVGIVTDCIISEKSYKITELLAITNENKPVSILPSTIQFFGENNITLKGKQRLKISEKQAKFSPNPNLAIHTSKVTILPESIVAKASGEQKNGELASGEKASGKFASGKQYNSIQASGEQQNGELTSGEFGEPAPLFRRLENFASKITSADISATRKLNKISLEDSGFDAKRQEQLLPENKPAILPDSIKLKKSNWHSESSMLFDLIDLPLKKDIATNGGVIIAVKGNIITKTLLEICDSQDLLETLKSSV